MPLPLVFVFSNVALEVLKETTKSKDKTELLKNKKTKLPWIADKLLPGNQRNLNSYQNYKKVGSGSQLQRKH